MMMIGILMICIMMMMSVAWFNEITLSPPSSASLLKIILNIIIIIIIIFITKYLSIIYIFRLQVSIFRYLYSIEHYYLLHMHENELPVSYSRSSIIYDNGYMMMIVIIRIMMMVIMKIYTISMIYINSSNNLSIYVSITPSKTNSSPFSSTMGHLPK